jgi:hypothetical protein
MLLAPETRAMAIAIPLLAIRLANALVRVLPSRTRDWARLLQEDHSAGNIAQVEAGDQSVVVASWRPVRPWALMRPTSFGTWAIASRATCRRGPPCQPERDSSPIGILVLMAVDAPGNLANTPYDSFSLR